MASASGRFMISFNGEIYNFQDIRRELEEGGVSFRGTSDTEVMLGAFERWGVLESLPRFNGMFAFAVVDRRDRVTHLCRDRLGVKPLYYSWVAGGLLFGSELSALLAHPSFKAEKDWRALALMLNLNHIPAPWSAYRNCYKLPPGCMLTVSSDSAAVGSQFSPFPGETAQVGTPYTYWSFRHCVQSALKNPFVGDESEAVEALDRLLADAVAIRMISDVPLGAFLSGGIDSSLIVALMQRASSRPVKTFSIGFREADYNEADHAHAIAHSLGTEHASLFVADKETHEIIPQLSAIYQEPFGDSSQIPAILVSRLARQYVTVSLSGEGGDEIFGGYNRYRAPSAYRVGRKLPPSLRRILIRAIRSMSPDRWNRIVALYSRLIPGVKPVQTFGDKAYKLADIWSASSEQALYWLLASCSFEADTNAFPRSDSDFFALRESTKIAELNLDPISRMLALDTIAGLPDDMLVKLDRATMSVGLEGREPLLDYRLVEFAWRLPLHMKIHDGVGKRILRQVLSKYVPSALVNRPKMGFGVPLAGWLRGGLRGWAEDLLNADRPEVYELVSRRSVMAQWAEHQSGQRNWHPQLWNLLMLLQWMK